jgi:hypothetical protein
VLTASPEDGWYFAHWKMGDGALVSDNPLELAVGADTSLTAVFGFRTPPPGTAALTIDSTGEGSVTPEPGTHVYGDGAGVVVTATAQDGWTFSHWQGDALTMAHGSEEGADAATSNPVVVVLTQDASLRAVFVEAQPGAPASPFGCVPADSSDSRSAGLPAGALLLLAAFAVSRRFRPHGGV